MMRRVKKKLINWYKHYILRDAFLLEVSRWFSDEGDEKLRLDYPLTKESVVFDVGGYHGDFAHQINQKYKCKVYIFEPVPEFYNLCVDRFKGNSKVLCLNYGLSSINGFLNISLADDASSIEISDSIGECQRVEVRSVIDCIQNLKIAKIDLFKINIEGGEFSVLPALVDSGIIKKINYLQVQFHNFIDDAPMRRMLIRKKLEKTHSEMWNYEFVWESWKLNFEDV